MDHGRYSLLWVMFSPAIALGDSMLWMQWQGLGPDAREITLAPGDTAVIEIYFRTDSQSQHLARLSFSNEPALALEQIDTSVLQPVWEDVSVDGLLGDASQQVDYQAGNCDPAPCPPPVLERYGTQTIRLNSVGDGQPREITFELASVRVVDFRGHEYSYLASSSPLLDLLTNHYHVAAGSPGYEDEDGFVDERAPLIVIPVPEPSTFLVLGFAAASFASRHRGHHRQSPAASFR